MTTNFLLPEGLLLYFANIGDGSGGGATARHVEFWGTSGERGVSIVYRMEEGWRNSLIEDEGGGYLRRNACCGGRLPE